MLESMRFCTYVFCVLVPASLCWDRCEAKEKKPKSPVVTKNKPQGPAVSSDESIPSREAIVQEPSVNQTMRAWSDGSGRKITAALISFDGTTVTLQKENGDKVSIAIEKFSEPDRTFIKNRSPAESSGTSELEAKCGELCDQISKSYNGRHSAAKPTIAVVEFSDLDGRVSSLGRLLSEELITRLFASGNYKVIERLLLNKAIAEHKLQLQGLVDPKSAKELGKILGVDAIVSGTVADLGDSLRVNARLMSTETGELLSVAATTIRKDDATKKLLAAVVGITTREWNPDASAAVPHGKADRPFREDFSEHKDGSSTNWGAGGKVRTRADGRKWLVPVGIGQKPIGIDANLPDNFAIEFDYDAEKLDSKRGEPKILSGITLIDESGAKYRIEWELVARGFIDFHTAKLRLPSGATMASGDNRRLKGTLRLQKEGDQIRVSLLNDAIANANLTGNVGDFKKFTRFEVDLYRSADAQISFTNFKIGNAAATQGGDTGNKKEVEGAGAQMSHIVVRAD